MLPDDPASAHEPVQSEVRYRTLFNALEEGFCVVELILDEAGKTVDYRFLETNEAFDAQSGLSREDARHKTMRQIAPAHEERWFEIYGEVARTGQSIRFEQQGAALAGRWFDLHAFRVGGEGSLQVGVLFLDITKRRASEQALIADRAHYETLFNSLEDGFCTFEMIFDPTGKPVDYRFLEVNPAFEAQTGLTREQALGDKTMREMVPDHEQKWYDIYGRVAVTGEPIRMEERAVALGRFYEIYAFRIGGENSREVGALFKDVAVRKRAEQALRESEAHQRAVLDSSAGGFYSVDAEGVTTLCNAAFLRMLGFERAEEVVGRKVHSLIHHSHPDGSPYPAEECPIYRAASQGISAHVTDEVFFRRDGSSFPVEYWSSPIVVDGETRGAVTTFLDATDRHERTRTLAFQRALTDTVIDLRDADAIVTTVERMLAEHLHVDRVLYGEFEDDEDIFTVRHDWTQGVPSLKGRLSVSAFGSRIAKNLQSGETDIIRDREREFTMEDGLDALRAGEAGAAITVPVRKDGRMVGVFAVNQRDRREWTDGEIGLVQQIGDRMAAEVERARAEEALRQANFTLEGRVSERTAELEAAIKEAEGFNYSVAHDLRTPLRAMVATSSILMEDLGSELSEQHLKLLERQVENAKRLGRLIDELLRLSRLARAAVNRDKLDLTREAEQVFADLSEHGRLHGCRAEIQPGMVGEGDPGLIRTVLHNLIGNAGKFSPQGGTIRIRQNGDVYSVADEGVGFDMKFAAKVFLPFERLVTESEFEGTGIGLANVERIVRRHGGQVWVESEPGKGTTFFFTLA